MEILVQFNVIKNKIRIEDYASYSARQFDNLQIKGLLDDYEFFDEETERENEYAVLFDRNFGEKWQVVIEKATFSNGVQLEFCILAENYELSIDENYLERLKVTLKDGLKNDWEQIIWLYDKDAELLSVDLYVKIFRAENRIRKFINDVMSRTIGVEWWNRYVPKKIKEKYDGRKKDYKTVVPSFNNIDDKLMSIDVGDLYKIIRIKKLLWNPQKNQDIEEELNNPTEGGEKRIVELLKKQTVVETDLWDKYFSKFFSESFEKDFHAFETNRNHVAHNKILDRTAYVSIDISVEKINKYFENAEKKMKTILLSAEDELEREREQEEFNESLNEIKESETGVSIIGTQNIMEIYEEQLLLAYNEIENALRFRLDIEMSYIGIMPDCFEGTLFFVKSKVTSQTLTFKYLASIDDSEGGTSSITIICIDDGKNEKLADIGEINYINGETEFDYDQGCYMPIGYSEFDYNSVDDFIDTAIEFISDNITNLKEYVDRNKYSFCKEENAMPVAEGIVCCECMQEYICIDDKLAPIGICLNCGAENYIAKCERCGAYFEDEWDDEIKLCSNCKEYYDND